MRCTATASIEAANSRDGMRYTRTWRGRDLAGEVSRDVGKAATVIRYGYDPEGWNALPL